LVLSRKRGFISHIFTEPFRDATGRYGGRAECLLTFPVKAVAVAFPLFVTKLLIQAGLTRWLPSIRQLSDGGAAFLHYYGDGVLCAPHGDLREMGEFQEIHGPDAINLALGEPRFDLAPSASTKLPAERRGWPPFAGLPELREAVAIKLRDDRNLNVSPTEEILITSGLAGAFRIAVDSFVNRGDRVALFDPGSPLYRIVLRQRRARIRWIPTWLESGRVRFHMQPMVRALRRARLIVVNSPANPTGGVFTPEDLEQIAWWADRYDVLIFSDEVFDRFVYESECLSIGTLPKAWRRTLTAGSASKGYGLAAARVGWLAGHRHLIRPCLLTAVLQGAWSPTLCQQIALGALRQGNEPFAPIRREFDSRRHYVYERLQATGLKPVWPAGGFFVWLPLREAGLSGITFARKLLQAKRVLVTPGEFFGPGGAGHVRISYATDDGRLREGLTRLAEFVRELRLLPASECGKAA
jgi:aspartate/methionine/tyrosine aminotransferase